MTDLRRAILLGLLCLIGMMLWNAWTIQHASKTLAAASSSTASIQTSNSLTPQNNLNNSTDISSPSSPQQQLIPAVQKPLANRYVALNTDVMSAVIDRLNGNLVGIKLLKYPVSLKEKNTPLTLLNNNPETYYIASSGVTGSPVVFNAAVKNNQIILTGKNQQGIQITKTYTFSENNYVISVTQQLVNAGSTPWQGHVFSALERKPVATTGMGPFNFNTYTGAVISSPEKRYEKISFKNMRENNINQTIQNGWAAMIQHYFLSAWIPDPHQDYHYYTSTNTNNIYTIGLQSPAIQLAPKQQYSTTQQLYIGPKDADRLKKIAPGLDLTVDYGILWFIADLIFSVMKKIHTVVGNWGWSIILVTLLIKIIFYKLNSISFRSMAKMRTIQPKIEQIRERCGDDRQKLAQATMELYRREKVNPLGGCLPLLVQIPVFLSLYWVIVESVQLRQAPFIFWIHDLSLKDPYYILPLLMGLTIFIQQQLGPKPPDPMQRKIMMAMPVIFTALFLSFPSGLVLYWVANNSLSILQQWYIMTHVVPKNSPKN